MARDPESLTLRLLRDIRATQNVQNADLAYLKKRVEDLYKISTHTLGVAVNAHARHEDLDEKVEKLTKRVARLEARQ